MSDIIVYLILRHKFLIRSKHSACVESTSVCMDLHYSMTEYYHVPKLQGKLKSLWTVKVGAFCMTSRSSFVHDKALNHHIKDMVLDFRRLFLTNNLNLVTVVSYANFCHWNNVSDIHADKRAFQCFLSKIGKC